MNWIDRRVRREQWLEIRTPQVWLDLRAALLECATTFRSYFDGHYELDLNVDRANCVQFFLREKAAPAQSPFEVRFERGRILAGANALVDTGITIDVEETRGFLVKNNTEIAAEEASRLLLEDFLFASKPKPKAMVA